MIIDNRSARAGASVALAATVILGGASAAMAETVFTVNGVDVDSSVLDMYLETRTQKPADQATAPCRPPTPITAAMMAPYGIGIKGFFRVTPLLGNHLRANELAELSNTVLIFD